MGLLKQLLLQLQEGRMGTHLEHMREHVVHGTTMNSNNIAVDRLVQMCTSTKSRTSVHTRTHALTSIL